MNTRKHRGVTAPACNRLALIVMLLSIVTASHSAMAQDQTQDQAQIDQWTSEAAAAATAADWSTAEELFKNLSEAQPDNAAHLVGLGRAMMMQGRYQEAIAQLTQARDASAPGPVHFFLARSYAGAGERDAMMESLEVIRAAGATPYGPIMAASEFRAYDDDAEFAALLQQLRPCQTADHRAFDFWIGSWDVYVSGTDTLAGKNTISRIEGGCVLHEQYATAGIFSGQSFNFYDAGRGVWHQTWADNQGTALYIEGGMVDGSMVLEDAGKSNRITFTPNADGSVRQHWEISSDAGETWSTAFDGRYVRNDKS